MRYSFVLLILLFFVPVFPQEAQQVPEPIPDTYDYTHISEEAATMYDELVTSLTPGELPALSCELMPMLRAFQEAPDVELPEGTVIETVETDTVKGAWFTPAEYDAEKVMLFTHGGGFILGSVFGNYSPLISWLADQTAYNVFAVEYRLAPENPYPAGLDDVIAAYRWLVDEQGYDPSQIVVAGDSAGGNLSIELLLALRDAGEVIPAAAWLYSPATDFTQSATTQETLIDEDPVLKALNAGDPDWRYCYTDEASFSDPAISPLFADLTGLPPLFVSVATNEALLGEIARFARIARASGVDVTVDVWDGLWHTWALDAPTLPESFQLYAGVKSWLETLDG